MSVIYEIAHTHNSKFISTIFIIPPPPPPKKMKVICRANFFLTLSALKTPSAVHEAGK